MLAPLLAAPQTPWAKPLQPPCPDRDSQPRAVQTHRPCLCVVPAPVLTDFGSANSPARVPVPCPVPAPSLPTDLAAAWGVLGGLRQPQDRSHPTVGQMLPGCGMLPTKVDVSGAPWAMDRPSGAPSQPRSCPPSWERTVTDRCSCRANAAALGCCIAVMKINERLIFRAVWISWISPAVTSGAQAWPARWG